MADDVIELLPRREWRSAIVVEEQRITAQAMRELIAFQKATDEIRLGDARR